MKIKDQERIMHAVKALLIAEDQRTAAYAVPFPKRGKKRIDEYIEKQQAACAAREAATEELRAVYTEIDRTSRA